MNKTEIQPWSTMRTPLLRAMEQRRRHADTFPIEQVYGFIIDASRLYKAPESDEGQAALENIQNTGSFRMAADTLDGFMGFLGLAVNAEPVDVGVAAGEELNTTPMAEVNDPACNPGDPGENADFAHETDPGQERRSRSSSNRDDLRERPYRGSSFRRGRE